MACLAKPAVSACLLLLLALPSEARQLSQLIQVAADPAPSPQSAASDVLAADPQALRSAVNASYGYLRRIVNPDTGRQARRAEAEARRPAAQHGAAQRSA